MCCVLCWGQGPAGPSATLSAGRNLLYLFKEAVQGFDRKRFWRNIPVAFGVLKSMYMARKIIKSFQPDVAIGVGGYASGAALKAANQLGVPTLLQEQNGFAGMTNKLLADKAEKICVAYEGMQRFFPDNKIILTGNPVRQNLLSGTKEMALKEFGFDGTMIFDLT